MTEQENAFLPFSRPTIDEATIEEVADSLRSGWITTGPKVQKFEQMLCDYFNAPFALALSTGTAGLHVALLGFGIKPGDEVIVPALTFSASANVVEMVGAKPVFVDVCRNTYNIDPEAIERAITPKTRAIMPVYFAGLPSHVDAIYDIAKRHNLRVLEDAAQAIGAQYDGKKIGSFGDTQMFSFHPNKNMTTGEGGCVTTRDEEMAKIIKVLRFHGIDRDAWNRFSKEGSQHYDIKLPGFKYNMMDIQAAIGLHQLPKLDEFIARRTELANRYFEAFEGWDALFLPPKARPQDKHNWHLFAPLINIDLLNMTRDDFMSSMKSYNIGIGFHYDCVHSFSYYANKYGYKQGDFPNAEFISKRIVSLPLFPLMTDHDQDRVISAMATIFKLN